MKLKTGGEMMMIAATDGEEAECVLYDGTKCFRRRFPLESLEAVSSFEFGAATRLRIYEEVSRRND